jgi:hypothetical protein
MKFRRVIHLAIRLISASWEVVPRGRVVLALVTVADAFRWEDEAYLTKIRDCFMESEVAIKPALSYVEGLKGGRKSGNRIIRNDSIKAIIPSPLAGVQYMMRSVHHQEIKGWDGGGTKKILTTFNPPPLRGEERLVLKGNLNE